MSTAAYDPSPVLYVECDVPDGMTLREWRAMRHPAATTQPRLSARIATRTRVSVRRVCGR